MRAIVTGSAGFIGSHLVDLLNEHGWDVLGVDRRTGPSMQRTETLPGSCDAIFHLASPVGPLGVIGWAGRLVPEVIETSQIASDWARLYACPLIDVSTSEVYGSGYEDAEADPCHFAAPTSARKEYAIGKLAAETMLRNTAGLDVRIVRPFNVAGPRQLPEGGFVLPRFVGQALRDEALTVYAPGTARRAFTHVRDIAEGIYAAYTAGESGEVYNLGNPANACTIEQLAEEVVAAVGRGRVEFVDPVAIHGPAFREAPDKVPKIDKARRDLGWEPRYDRAAVIAETIAYWR